MAERLSRGDAAFGYAVISGLVVASRMYETLPNLSGNHS